MKLMPLAVALTALTLPALALAQLNPAFSEIAEATEQARTILQAERKQVISDGLNLSDKERAAFWPVYDKYAADIKTANDLRIKVITDYAASYENLSDKTAKQLISDMLKYQGKILHLRKHYLGKFRKTLPETKLARFYQLENKLDSIANFALARQIPLVPPRAADRPIAQPAD